MKPDNNIPAYPMVTTNSEGQITDRDNEGLTLLDHFAGQAMQGHLASGEFKDIPEDSGLLFSLCHESYTIAAAMLEARKQFID